MRKSFGYGHIKRKDLRSRLLRGLLGRRSRVRFVGVDLNFFVRLFSITDGERRENDLQPQVCY